MNSYINPLAFRDRYAEDYCKADSVAELLNRWPGWAVHAEKEILDIKGSLEPEVRKYVQVQDVLERLAGSGRLGVPNLQEVSVREEALAVFDSTVPTAWAVTLQVPYVVLCGPELKNPDLQAARKIPAGWYGMTTGTLVVAVPELDMWAEALLECAKRGWMDAQGLVHLWGQPHETAPEVALKPILICTGRHADMKALVRMVDKDEMDRPVRLCGHRWALCSQLTMGQTLWVLGRLWAEGLMGRAVVPQQLLEMCKMLNLKQYEPRWFE